MLLLLPDTDVEARGRDGPGAHVVRARRLAGRSRHQHGHHRDPGRQLRRDVHGHVHHVHDGAVHGCETPDLQKVLETRTGLAMSSFQGCYAGGGFLVD